MVLILFTMAQRADGFAEDTQFCEIRTGQHSVGTVVFLYSEPTTKAPIVGELLVGTKAKVLDVSDEWANVSATERATGFVLTNQITLLETDYLERVGAEEIGYAVVNQPAPAGTEKAYKYWFPSTSAERVNNYAIGNGDCFEVVAVLGDWCQIRRMSDADLAFVQTVYLDIYLLNELLVVKCGTLSYRSSPKNHLYALFTSISFTVCRMLRIPNIYCNTAILISTTGSRLGRPWSAEYFCSTSG